MAVLASSVASCPVGVMCKRFACHLLSSFECVCFLGRRAADPGSQRSGLLAARAPAAQPRGPLGAAFALTRAFGCVRPLSVLAVLNGCVPPLLFLAVPCCLRIVARFMGSLPLYDGLLALRAPSVETSGVLLQCCETPDCFRRMLPQIAGSIFTEFSCEVKCPLSSVVQSRGPSAPPPHLSSSV